MTAPSQGAPPPKPACKLVGTDGNVFAIIGRVRQALDGAGQRERASEFLRKAYASQAYDEVLRLAMEYVDVQ